ncbi:MAG TPA: DnaA N-terminal domain-containing protein [Archangium sp.]|nr:DnaA N-terminal domain-containing protein [Archangium sp.]
MPQELAALRAELEQERLARARAEARLEGFREAVALFVAARPAEALAPPLSPPVTRDSVTPSVTAGSEEERSRALARERKRVERARKRSVTPSVTQEEEKKNIHTLPPSPSVTPSRGKLAIVTVAARDSQRDRPRALTAIPPEVQALRASWNELAAPHGFPAWERTSAKLLQDALAALERRPLEEWRRFFALVPRSPLCRGELRRRQRADLVWLLSGRTPDGYEPAEKLLSGGWSIDPEPGAQAAPGPDSSPEGAPALETLPEDTPAASAWKRMLQALHADGKDYALTWLRGLCAREVCEGELVLEAPDRFFADWVGEHYGELLGRMGALEGLRGVRFTGPAGEGSP